MYFPWTDNIKIGFLVNNLGSSQLGYYLTKNINKWKNPNVCLSVFVENLTPHCLMPRFAIFNISEAYGFDGILIATSLTTASKLLKCPCSQKKFFYLWDLEWQRGNQRPTNFFRSIYNSELNLIARTKYHAQAVINCWNKIPIGYTNDFNLETIVELCTIQK